MAESERPTPLEQDGFAVRVARTACSLSGARAAATVGIMVSSMT
jgi:hypothetical protein